ncbi:MAG: hypothetical protein HYX69_21265 [Planctomycetia bacterium]|nr:hypothetical protein [Planctomycetia bacterium]
MRSVKYVSVAIVGVAVVAAVARAQIRDAGAKLRGDYGGMNRSASRSLYHARDYAYDYNAYARDAIESKRPVTPEMARHHSEGLGQNIQQAQKHFTQVRKQAGTDKETLASLDLIDKHLKDAAKSHADMHEMCMKDEVDAQGSMKCCTDATQALEKAIAEHDKLMKRLAAKKPAGK